MAIDPNAVGRAGEPGTVSWTSQDSLLYSLAVGAGANDPTGFELEFTTENSIDTVQRALPTQVVVLGGGRPPDFGKFDFAAMLHAEQEIELHRPLSVEGAATVRTVVAGIYDKGKAAVVRLESTADDAQGEPLWTSRSSLFVSGEGGWGGDRGPKSEWLLPGRDPDEIVSYGTRGDQALLYRLTGDRNPLHSDPSFAKRAGFDRPILHGLCTFGFTGRALLHACCDGDPACFGSMRGRFKSPVMPGERLDVRVWREGDRALFQTCVGDRVVLDAGIFTSRNPI